MEKVRKKKTHNKNKMELKPKNQNKGPGLVNGSPGEGGMGAYMFSLVGLGPMVCGRDPDPGTQNAVSVLQSGCSLHWWMCSTCGDFFTQASSSFSHRSSSPASAIFPPRPPHPVPAIRTIKTGIQRTEMAAWVLDNGRFAEKPSSTGLFYASSHQAGSCLFL